MSRPILLSDVINHIIPSHNRIAKLILSTLQLEEKLANPEEQSVYFRWAIRNSTEDKEAYLNSYYSMRQEFNDYTVDDLIAEKEEEEKILRDKIPSVRPRFAQAFWRGACISRINKYNDYLSVKSITSALPPWEQLKNDPDLLTEILEA